MKVNMAPKPGFYIDHLYYIELKPLLLKNKNHIDHKNGWRRVKIINNRRVLGAHPFCKSL